MKFNNNPSKLQSQNKHIKLSELFDGIEIEVEYDIRYAQEFLQLQIEEMHHAIQIANLGDTSIITVNGEVFLSAKWEEECVWLDFHKEQFPIMGLFGCVLMTVKHLRGEEEED